MNRQEITNILSEKIVDWDNWRTWDVECISQILRDRSLYLSTIGYVSIKDVRGNFDVITKQDWLEAKAGKEAEIQVFKNGKDGDKVDVPEGTTHVLFDDDDYTFALYKMYGYESIDVFQRNKWRYWGVKGEHESECDFIKIEDAIIQDAQKEEWQPEIGQECEFSCTARGNEYKWTVCKVKYNSRYTCVIKSPLISGEFIAHPDTIKFRPLKTQEEVDTEELAKILNNHVESETGCRTSDMEPCRKLAKYILNQGYKK